MALQHIHRLRWTLLSHPPTAVHAICLEQPAAEDINGLHCEKTVLWKKSGEWESVCVDYAVGDAAFSPRHYLIQLHCTWMAFALPPVEAQLFR